MIPMRACPTCDGTGAGSAPFKGLTSSAGMCPDCRATGEVTVAKFERLTAENRENR